MTMEDRSSGHLRGVAWMTLAAFFFAMMIVAGRRVSHLPSIEITFFQTGGAVICLLPWLIARGPGGLRTANLAMHLVRGLAAFAGMSALFYAARFTPAADITALLFLSVLFTVLLAAVFLNERVGFGRWVAILVGFAGALIVIRPGFEAASWPALIMLFVALAFGAVNTATRFLAGAENPNAIVFYMYGLMCLYALVPTILVWQTPAWTDVPWLAATGAFAAVAQQGITRSLSMAPTAIAMPAYYLQLPFAAVAGYFLFGEAPGAWIWLGAAVICGATYYVIRAAPPERR